MRKMNISPSYIKVRDIVDGYRNNEEDGAFAYGGKLNIRPAFQREFVYDIDKQKSVINSILKGYPLNVMYWFKNSYGGYEMLDGQQRTLSICEFIHIAFDIDEIYFSSLSDEDRDKILDYKLTVYICEGTDKDKLNWFEIINISGEKLTNQELLNAIFTGPWLYDAKKFFSKSDCLAYDIGRNYIPSSKKVIRQDYLEIALKWISDNNIKKYMSEHQHDSSAEELVEYFENVINWIKRNFPEVRKEMKSINWGSLYNEYKNVQLDPIDTEKKIQELIEDPEVTSDKGVYEYILTKNEKFLNLRVFDKDQKKKGWLNQDKKCNDCEREFPLESLEGHHINEWSEGGKTVESNLSMLCKDCHATYTKHFNKKRSNQKSI